MVVGRFRLMQMLAVFCVASGLTLAGCSVPAPAPAQQNELLDSSVEPAAIELYKLGPGDVISIRVYGEDDLSREKIRLTESMMLTLPFGNLSVRGLTVSELQKAIANGLRGRFLVNPRVSVAIEEYRPFFMQGQVARPGGYPYQPGLNVRKAVSIAGGFKERASLSKIFIVRENDQTNTPTKIDLNSPVSPGDTITVEESFF